MCGQFRTVKKAYLIAGGVEVDATHPEVMEMVESAVKLVEAQEITLSPDAWITTMQEAIDDCEKKNRDEGDKNSPM